MSRAELDDIHDDTTLLDRLQKEWTSAAFGELAALLILDVPDRVNDQTAARTEALRILSIQMRGDKQVARRMINDRVTVYIIPRDQLLTDLPSFQHLENETTKDEDPRPWPEVRGVGDAGMAAAIAEEDLLGGTCDVEYEGRPLDCRRAAGSSTSAHEFAHLIQIYGLSDKDRGKVEEAFTRRKQTARQHREDPAQWVDGREGCYASTTPLEFFAQLSSAYLGTNTGTDPFTLDPRHNGKKWVKRNEPVVYRILNRLYGGATLSE